MSVKLYVGNVSFGATNEDLESLFSQVGQVDSVNIVKDRDSGRSRGFAFVEMANRDEANAAIEKVNGHDLNGRALTVNEARPKEERSSGGGGGGGRRGGPRGGGAGGYGSGGGNRREGGGGYRGGSQRERGRY